MQYPIIDLITDAYINNGWTGLDISTGKNLLDPQYRTVTTNSVRYYYPNAWLTLSAGTYTVSCSDSVTALYVRNPDGVITVKYNTTQVTFTLNEETQVGFVFYNPNGINPNLLCQLEIGTQATPYEPYGYTKNDFPNRLKLPLPHYFPHPVIDSLKRASEGTMTNKDKEILTHYLTPLGIGGI